jgi:hypothetical protein
MAPPNLTWRGILAQALSNPEIIKQPEIIKNVQNILQTNTSVCSSLGQPFLSQISHIYLDMLKLYRCAPMMMCARAPHDGSWCTMNRALSFLACLTRDCGSSWGPGGPLVDGDLCHCQAVLGSCLGLLMEICAIVRLSL